MRLKVREDRVVERGEIIRVVRELMVREKGNVIKSIVKELKEASVMALSMEGSSPKALAYIANKWTSSVMTLSE
ncbi:hypothetical protein IEQ34_021187 [Dendrobium chrysotoxum]|uniref:Uncharacterized protein n=1 Tax=Dendrobium chrysotoxum TaxID=161865 RepID=A0AAV7FL88_DENCH|nr:hypothetical protein IEQ34_021187 [Dendrobium chrysotoxum]